MSGTCTLDCFQKPPWWKNKMAANPRRTAPEYILHYYIALSYAAQVNMRIWCALGGCQKLPAQKKHWTPSSGGALGAPLGDPGCLLGVSRGVPAPRKRHHNTLCCMHHFLTCESGVKKFPVWGDARVLLNSRHRLPHTMLSYHILTCGSGTLVPMVCSVAKKSTGSQANAYRAYSR